MFLGKDDAESGSEEVILTRCHLMRENQPWVYRSGGAAYTQRNKTREIMGHMRGEKLGSPMSCCHLLT